MSIGNQKTKDDGYVMVGTKVPPHVAELLNIIATAKGTDIYGLIQQLIETIIRAAKCETDLDPATKLLLNMIEMDNDWNRAFRFSHPSAQMDVAQIILVLQQYDGKGANRQPRKGYGLVMIDKPWMPGTRPTKTICVDKIFERVTEVAMQGLYKELRLMGTKMETRCVRDTLMQLCDAQLLIQMDEETQEELPDLGNCHEFGRVIEWGNKYKQRKHRTPDSLANSQQRIIFDDFDRDIADMEVSQGDGLHYIDDPLAVANIHPDFDGIGMKPEQTKEGGDDDTR